MPSFEHYLRAGFPLIWVETPEPHRAQRELTGIAKLVHEETEPLCWDIVGGLRKTGADAQQPVPPVQAIKTVASTSGGRWRKSISTRCTPGPPAGGQ